MNAVVKVTDPNEWLTLEQVAVALCCSIHNLSNNKADLLRAVTRRPEVRDERGGTRYMYLRSDIARITRIRKACHVSVPVACRVLLAFKAGQLP